MGWGVPGGDEVLLQPEGRLLRRVRFQLRPVWWEGGSCLLLPGGLVLKAERNSKYKGTETGRSLLWSTGRRKTSVVGASRSRWRARGELGRGQSCRVSQTMVRYLDLFCLNGRTLESFQQRHDLKALEYVFKRFCWDCHSLGHRMLN